MFEEQTGLGGRASGAGVKDAEGFENSVDRGRRDRFEEIEDFRGKESELGLVGRYPLGENGFEALGARQVGEEPDLLKGFEDLGPGVF